MASAIKCPKCGTLQQPADVCRKEECKTDMRGLKSPLAGRRFYDLRHQCITEMLESGVPEGTIREVAGYIDPDMTRRYSHPRRAARHAAVAPISVVKAPPASQPGLSEGGYVTNHVTKALSEGGEASYLVETIGRDGQI